MDNDLPEETVTISVEEYNELLADSNFLDCLISVGVNNWDGYEVAQDMFENEDQF